MKQVALLRLHWFKKVGRSGEKKRNNVKEFTTIQLNNPEQKDMKYDKTQNLTKLRNSLGKIV